MKQRVILIIMDGYGIRKGDYNAVAMANSPNLRHIFQTYPTIQIQASGVAVGLPEGQMGNSEVGHLNIGAGRIVHQDITRIDLSIKQGDFFHLPILIGLADTLKRTGNALHLIGLISDGCVHSSMNHLFALIKFARDANLSKLYIHAITDGRDTSPHGGIKYIRQVETVFRQYKIGEIATVIGRYDAMDRDKRWKRTERAYRVMVYGDGLVFYSAEEAIKDSYLRDITDEFILPSVIIKNGRPTAVIRQDDGVIFFNFRADRTRQLTRAFTMDGFKEFPVRGDSLRYITMTRYDETFKVPYLFGPNQPKKILGEIISDNGLKQLRITETEKYPHVTYFFNGGEETPFPGEDRIMIPSPKVATYDLKPQMSAPLITDKVVSLLKEHTYDLMVVNFANCDMVGHTGIMDAAIKAVEAVDHGVGMVWEAAKEAGYVMLLTADHGNAEQMHDDVNGGPFTAHTTNPVPFVVLGMGDCKLRSTGALCDIAPTILQILGIPQPTEMTGESLIVK
jgi:2,3-bisphosphoglycerate-independent phosphoglycerate mutase